MRRVLRILLLFIPLSFFLLSGCGGKKHIVYRIGIDPLFFPQDFKRQTINVFAFSSELLQEISKVQNLRVTRINRSWDNLIEGLCEERYDAILSTLPPSLINRTNFTFSEPYLKTGPVLVVPKTDKKITIEDLSRRILAIEQSDPLLQLMSNYPDVRIVFYNQIPVVLEDVATGRIDGALVPTIPANAFVKDLFGQRLSITTDPLTSEGLRLVTLRDDNQFLLKQFNEGLDKLIRDGTYDKLLDKWLIR